MDQKSAYQTRSTISSAIVTFFIVLLALPLSAQADEGGHGEGHVKQASSAKHNDKGRGHNGKSRGKSDGKKKAGQVGKKNKARMTVCHYSLDGDFEQKSLPAHAAMKHLANHELDREPVVGADGVESCVPVQAPETTCKITVNGTEFTVAEWVAAQNTQITDFNTDSNSCEINDAGGAVVALFNNADGQGLDIFFSPGNNRLLIGSQQQYDDCAFDIETVAQTNENCPDVVQFNTPQ